MFIFLTKLVAIPTVIAMMSTCQGHQATKTKAGVTGSRRHHHKTELVAKPVKPRGTPNPSLTPETVKPDRTGDIVNLEWVTRYDALLRKHGNQLSSPKQPGDREGITVEGANDRVSPEVLKRNHELEALEQADQAHKTKQTR